MRVLVGIFALSVLFLRSMAQTIPTDSLLAKKHLDKAMNMLENRQYDKFDSILVYSDAAAVTYTRLGNWSGLIKSLNCEIEVFARNAIAENVQILFDSISKVNNHLISKDNILFANTLHNVGLCYHNLSQFDAALEYYTKSLNIRKSILGEESLEVAQSYNNIGSLYGDLSKFDDALNYYFKSLEIRKKILGESNLNVAINLVNIGNQYRQKSDYKKALEFSLKALDILKKELGEGNYLVASNYLNIGSFYADIYNYDKARYYNLKSIEIFKNLFGEKSVDLAVSYLSLGLLHYYCFEYDKALEFYFKSLNIFKDKFGEKHVYTARCYEYIGSVYNKIEDYDKALTYYLSSLQIYEELYGSNHIDVANMYSRIGIVYRGKMDNVHALENFNKSSEIIEKLQKGDLRLATNYSNIGDIYFEQRNIEKALLNFNKDIEITKFLLGEKSGKLALSYNKKGQLLLLNNDCFEALKFVQKALVSNFKLFNDSIDLVKNPVCTDYFDQVEAINSFLHKAILFDNLADSLKTNKRLTIGTYNLSKEQLLRLSFQNYQMCDTIINQTRKKLTKSSDKVTFGDKAKAAYELAIKFCNKTANSNRYKSSQFIESAVYYSEQIKGIALLQSLAENESMQYAGLPDSLLQKEHSLKTDIAYFEKKLVESVDSSLELKYRADLFSLNRQYEALITSLENNFPNYYMLKYSVKQPSLKEIQGRLDKKTAIRSYFLGDSNLYVITITKKDLKVQEIKGAEGIDDSIKVYRSSISGDPKYFNHYLSSGAYLYGKLFPSESLISDQIEHLVIVPDGSLAFIPFESLPMRIVADNGEKLQTVDSLRGFKNVSSIVVQKNYKDFPFLIKKYNVSYAYSVTLYYQSCTSKSKSQKEKAKPNFLAIAPVFSDVDKHKATSGTIDFQRSINFYQNDTLSTRGSLLNGDYVTPLPGTETEVNSIKKEFELQGLATKVLLKDAASEHSIKSGILENNKILHFATHGFVNSEKPELSGLLLYQDSTGGQDGILYSGELYNLKLNADLTVLSACETGLGKVRKGEGIMGLTRALLYAGSKNVIVSLWPVSDQSTSELMIDFYNNLLKSRESQSYSIYLRNAKLKMINEGKYSNPFYWSPFILIGQ